MTPDAFLAWRQRLGLTQTAAAKALGLSRSALINYEHGVRPVPKPVALACAAVALGIREYPG